MLRNMWAFESDVNNVKRIDVPITINEDVPDEVSSVSNAKVSAGIEKEVLAGVLGDLGYHYLNVTNNDAALDGKFSVKIL